MSSAILVSCSSYRLIEPQVPPVDAFGPAPADAACVCVVRTSMIGSAVTFPTRDNGQLVGATRGRGHFCYLAEPGFHEIEVEADGKAKTAFHAVAGLHYVLKQNVSNSFGIVNADLEWIEQKDASEALSATPYEILEATPNEELVPEQPPRARAKH